MSKSTPLQNVKKLYGSKDQLVSKVAALFTPAEGESAEEFSKRLKYVANAKLLRLLQVGEKVKELGGRSALVSKVAELKGQAKDKDFATMLGTVSLPRLLDTYQALHRKSAAAAKAASGAAKPVKQKAIVKPKAEVKKVESKAKGAKGKKSGKK